MKKNTLFQADLLTQLQLAVDLYERKSLIEEDDQLLIGHYNREIILEMLNTRLAPGGKPLDAEKVNALYQLLKSYLKQYMADQPQGHKWIILSSLYRAFIAEKPIHPVEITNVRMIQKNGKTLYICPCRENAPGSVCHFCVCR